MIHSKHWLVCLDLSQMDDVLIGYTAFLSSVVKPETITFLHIIESGPETLEIIDQFPEVKNMDQFEKLIRNELNEKIKGRFESDTPETRIMIKEGIPTEEIISISSSLEPDLLAVGFKVGYAGEGIIPKRILRYVPCSVLFVPENSRYSISSILVPIDFSEQSANALKTASHLAGKDGSVTAQHIYQYRAQFFPYVLSEEERRKVDRETEEKMKEFREKYDLPSDTMYELSQHKDGKVADVVYDMAIHRQADLLVTAAKSKGVSSLMRRDFIDKMVDYAFGIPLLIQKNKEKYRKFLDIFRS
jgi:nucleotide-binding universal stress UspA family protein